MKKAWIILLFIYSSVLAQNFGISAKYSLTFDKEYITYNSFLLGANLLLLDNSFEVGVIAGINYSHLNNNILTNYNNSPSSYYTDIILSASVFGGSFKYYPVTFMNIYSPFIEIRGTKFYDNRLLLPMGGGIWSSGFYNFSTKNDISFSIIGGVKINPSKINNINITLELGFQKRSFNINYSEYGDYSNLIATHSEYKHIYTVNFGIGLQYVF